MKNCWQRLSSMKKSLNSWASSIIRLRESSRSSKKRNSKPIRKYSFMRKTSNSSTFKKITSTTTRKRINLFANSKTKIESSSTSWIRLKETWTKNLLAKNLKTVPLNRKASKKNNHCLCHWSTKSSSLNSLRWWKTTRALPLAHSRTFQLKTWWICANWCLMKTL